MPHRNLRKIFFSEKILLMHQFWFLSFPLYELKTIPARMRLCFCLPGLLLSLWIFLSHQTFYSSMLSVYNSELLTVWQERTSETIWCKAIISSKRELECREVK